MNTHPVAPASSRLTVRTVVVRISRKLRAVYRLRSGRRFSHLLLAMLALVSPLAARALPQGMQVQAGQVTLTQPNAASMVLNQGTNKAILDWQSFSIGTGQSVRFVQPGASSVALNRVVGGDLSSIYGTLSANGQVFLVNPAGVLFAPGAQVNVGGLVASTLGLSNADFLAGRYQFSGAGGSVVNQGQLQGGYIVLAAPTVSNQGSIAANGGSVGLLAGSRVSVDPAGAGLVKFSVDAAAVNAAIANSGTITADGGQVAVLASAVSDTLPTVINQSGVIRANSIADHNGTIVLSGGSQGIVDVSGTLQARGAGAGQSGGTIQVLGDRVGLRPTAAVDARGDAGGGTVLVGGNYQGQGPERNATVAVVAPGASIDASATGSGDGGKVVVWSDGATAFAGAIQARGGAGGGNGGAVEVSGKRTLSYTGHVDATAPKGRAGSLLLDPDNIIIVSSGPDINGDGTPGDDLTTNTLASGTFPGATSRITDTAIEAQLGAANVTLAAVNNITQNAGAPIDAAASPNRLTLRSTSNGTIALNDAVNVGGGFSAITAGAGTINVLAPITTSTGSIVLSTTGGTINLGADLDSGTTATTLAGSTRLDGARTITAANTTFNGTLDGNSAGGADSLVLSGRGQFRGVVGASDPLASLQVGGTSSLAGNVTTIGSQTYTGTATLTGDATLTSTANSSITFGGAVRGTTAGAEALSVVNGGGLTTFGGAVGTAAVPLQSLSTSGPASLGGNVQTTGSQAYGGNVTLTADAALTSQAGGTVSFAGTVNGTTAGTEALTVNTSGSTVFGSTVGGATALQSLTTDAGGTTSLAGSVTTSGAQTYNDAVVLAGDVTATSTGNAAIAFNAGVNGTTAGTESLTVNTGGTTTFGSAVGGGTALEFLTTDAGGTTRLGGNVTTRDAQTYNDNVVLTGNVTATSLNNFNVTFGGTVKGTTAGAEALTVTTAGNTAFGGSVGAGTALASLTTNGGGVTFLGGNVTTTGAQTYADNVVLTADTTSTSTGNAAIGFGGTVDGNTAGAEALTVKTGGTTTFASTVGATTALQSLATDAGGTTRLGGNVTTQNGQTYGDNVVLTGDVVATSLGNGAIAFDGTVEGTTAGTESLTVDTGGTTTFASTVGAVTPLQFLATDAGGTTRLGGNVTTQDGQTYGDNVVLTGNVTATSLGNADIRFDGTVRGTTAGSEALVVNTGGNTVFGGSVGGGTSLASLTTNAGGTTFLGGNVTTAGAQSYGDNVVLTADTTATSTGNAAIAFGGTVNGTTAGAEALTVNTGGSTSFAASVGSTTALQSLATSGGGTTSLGGSVTTTAGQTYNDNVVLAGDVTATSTGGSGIAFNGTVNGTTAGGESLTVDTAGSTTFASTVGSATALDFLTTDAGGTTRLGGNVTTQNAQTYNDNVVLTGSVTATSLGNADIRFNGSVRGTTAGTEALAVNTAGNTVFGSTVGAGTSLASLSTNAGGTTFLGGNVTTAGAQSYGDNVVLTADTTATSTGNAGITFAAAVNGTTAGAEALRVDTGGATTFASSVGATTALQSLATDAGGTTFLGGNVTTQGGQTYGDNVVLTADVSATSTGGGAIAFGGTVNGTTAGTEALSVNTSGMTTFASTVGATTALQSLATDAGGTTRLGGNVTTATTQSYGDNVVLTNDTVLAGSAVSFGGSVNGTTAGTESLTVSAPSASFGGAVGNSRALQFLVTGGATSLGGNVTTLDQQSYGGNVTLTADVTATSTAGGNVGFAGAVNGTTAGNEALRVNTTGTTSFAGPVGNTVALQSLTTDAGGTTRLASNVTTAAGQAYNDAVVLTGDVVASSTGGGAIAFNGTVDGTTAGNEALTVNTAGVTTFASTVGATTALQSLATDAGGSTRLGGNVTTATTQSYGDNVVLTGDAVLTGSAVSFGGSVNGTSAGTESLTVAAPSASFAGPVGSSRALEFLSTSGATSLGGNVTTLNQQAYGGNVTLTGDVVATSTGDANITFGGSVNGTTPGGESLTVNTAGVTTFAGPVGNTVALQSLATDAGGSTRLGGNVTTSGGQAYNDNVVLTADVTSTSTGGGNVAFVGTVEGSTSGTEALTVNTAGSTTFGSTVGAATPLQSLATDAAGVTRLGGNVTTATTQSYGDNVVLTNDVVLAGTGVSFGGTVNGTTAGAQSLTVSAPSASFAGAVGASRSLEFLSTSGSTSLGGNVTTAGLQSYGGAVTLTGNVTSTSTGDAAITFAGPVDGAQSLTVNTGGATTFASTIGGTTALQSVATTGGGVTSLGGNVSTSGSQNFADDVVLATDVAASSTGGGAITFGGTVNGTTAGNESLSVFTGGTTSFGASVGGGTALQFLATDAGGSTRLGGNVTTAGAQTYGDPVVLTGDVAATSTGGAAITFAGTVNGSTAGTRDLTVTTAGSTVFAAPVGTAMALASLTANGGGTTSLGGSVTTTGAQTYADAVTLAADATLTGASISAPAGLDGGGHDLTLLPTGSADVAGGSNIGTLTFKGGSLDGSYTAGTYQLDGGVVNAALGGGTLRVAQGTTTLNGTSAAGTVNVQSGLLRLGPTPNRLTAATTVTIASGATLDSGTAAQTIGAAASPAAVTNAGTLVDSGSLTIGSLAGGGALRTLAGTSLTTTGALSAPNATIGGGTTLTAGGPLSVTGDFAGAVTVNGATPSVTLHDTSAGSALNLTEVTDSAGSVNVRSDGAMVAGIEATSATDVALTAGTTMALNQLMVSPQAAVTLNAGNNMTVNAQNLSPVRTLYTGSANGSVHFTNSRLDNGGQGVLATGGITVNIPHGELNTPADPMLIHPGTPSLSILAALAVWIDSTLFTQVQTNVVGAGQSETDRFTRMMLRNDAGILPVENLVLLGNTPLDAVVAPLSFPSLQIRLPDCLAEQRNQEGNCAPPARR